MRVQVLPGPKFGEPGQIHGRVDSTALGTLIYLILPFDFSHRILSEIMESLDDVRDRYGQFGA